MSSGIFVTIKLEPFYQQFLCGHFNKLASNFSFPKGEDLAQIMLRLLRTPPQNYSLEDYGSLTFRIEIPYNSYKNPVSYSFMSETAKTAFIKSIKRYFDTVFHERMNELRKDGHEKLDCVKIFLDEINMLYDPNGDIIQKNIDRLLKDYQRWRNRIINQRFRKNGKKNYSLNSRFSLASSMS